MAIDRWADRLQGQRTRMWFSLGDQEALFRAGLERAQAADVAARIWAREGALWSRDAASVAEAENRLGWLDLPKTMVVEVSRLKALAAEIRATGLEHVVLLGMGGSSLAPETMTAILGGQPGSPDLVILDTTDPTQIRRVMGERPLLETLFIVASKSGGTAESLNLYDFFRSQLEALEPDAWAQHFVAITDPGSKLAKIAETEGFRAVYLNPANIGGRYSALSLFGLVPAALIGADIEMLLDRAGELCGTCDALESMPENPGVALGVLMGELARAGAPRDKLTLISSPELTSFGPWAEQLVAESTGKEGVGILPVIDEGASPTAMGSDRLYVYLRLDGGDNNASDARVEGLLERNEPVVLIGLRDCYDLGTEFFRWQFATAVAGQVLSINPFDQPNVESAKVQARTALARYEKELALPSPEPAVSCDPLSFFGDGVPATDCADFLARFFSQAEAGGYLAIMAYVDRLQAFECLLGDLAKTTVERLGIATTVGFGPRFLHSTGQLHKGGQGGGLYVQITQDEDDDLDIPGKAYSFGILKMSQALGDLSALRGAERSAIRVNIGPDVSQGLDALATRWIEALAGLDSRLA